MCNSSNHTVEECCSHSKVVVDRGARIDGRDPRRSNFQGNDEQAKIEDKDSTVNKKGNFVRVGTESRRSAWHSRAAHEFG